MPCPYCTNEESIPAAKEEVWTAKNGRKIKVGDMSIEHLRNVVRMFVRRRNEQKQSVTVADMSWDNDHFMNDDEWDNDHFMNDDEWDDFDSVIAYEH